MSVYALIFNKTKWVLLAPPSIGYVELNKATTKRGMYYFIKKRLLCFVQQIAAFIAINQCLKINSK